MTKTAYAKPGGGIEGITMRDMPVPVPGHGEALVRLKAATLNFRDLLLVRGAIPGTKTPDYVPISDAAGEVVTVGAGVTRVKPDDRVSPIFVQGWLTGDMPGTTTLGGGVDGVGRHFAVFDAENLCLIPDEVGDLEAAALPCAGITAWSALFGPRPLKAGEWILVQGTGGVSLAALQWAKGTGANVVITSSSDAKLRRAKALGADITINYRTTPDWAGAAREALGGKGVDIVVDVVGASQVEDCARALNEGGIIAAVGMLTGPPSWGKDVGKPIIPIAVGNRERHEAMLAFCAKHGIRPVIDAVYDLNRLPDALRQLERGEFFGKIGINLL
jgi:NADPH:quinone reductase-like Zn-dependent oxidoreductase